MPCSLQFGSGAWGGLGPGVFQFFQFPGSRFLGLGFIGQLQEYVC